MFSSIGRIFFGVVYGTWYLFIALCFIVSLLALLEYQTWWQLFWFLVMVYIVWLCIKPKKNKRRDIDNEPITRQSVEVADFRWSNDGDFDVEVVGESFYQDNLKALVGKHKASGCRVYGTGVLCPEENNPYDKQAVAVYVKTDEDQPGRQVGHLSRQNARQFRRRLKAKKLGTRPTLCDAVIVGGKRYKGKRQSYGVWLDMKPFD